DRWRRISASDPNLGREARPRGFLRRTDDCSWVPRTDPERFNGLLAARRPDRDRHFLRGIIHVHDSVLVHQAGPAAATARLGLRAGEKICALELPAATTDADSCRRTFCAADRDRIFAGAAAAIRSQCSFAGAEKQPSEPGVA